MKAGIDRSLHRLRTRDRGAGPFCCGVSVTIVNLKITGTERTMPKSIRCAVLLGIAIFLLCASTGWAQDEEETPSKFDVKANYTKFEYRIPMRDGVNLFTAVYVPKDASKSYPFLMTRTPYTIAPYGESNYPKRLGPAEEFEKAGYIFVYQDVRGRWMSEGKWEEMTPHIDHPKGTKDVDESTDTYDTVEWLLKHVPNNNGKVGIYGHLVSGLLHFGEHYRFASGDQGGVAAGADDGPVHERRRLPWRGVHAGCQLWLLHGFKQEKGPLLPPKAQVGSTSSIMGRRMATSIS